LSDKIDSVAALEACIGTAALPVKMKIIDHLDATAERWIAASPLAFLGFGGAGGPRATIAGGAPGVARAVGAKTLRIPRAALDDAQGVVPGLGAGAVFLIPGIGETLRANGRVAAVSDEAIDLEIEECFVHCAKALLRSDFWAPRAAAAPDDANAFVDASRFLALVTMDASGRIDISPKGDPEGLLVRLREGVATLAERPGNRLAFGYRNIIDEPRVAALALVPGASDVVALRGRAHLSNDPAVRDGFVVAGKTPILTTVIETQEVLRSASEALRRAAPWSATHTRADVDPAATLVAHVKLNKARGVGATLLRLTANRGLVATGLKKSYETDLY